MKLNKTKKRRRLNQGNSFIVVIATISFLAVLVTALLVAVALCYRMKAYEINSRDNFYSLEKAMDSIYEGVGEISMKHLNDAYNETLETLVYFDPAKESYVTKTDEQANNEMKQSFINKLNMEMTSGAFSKSPSEDKLQTTLNTLAGADSTITVSHGNVTMLGDKLTIHDVVLKRKAAYSTVNASNNGGAKTDYVQSITTDLVISAPEYDVDFTNVGNDVEELYDFVMISDMGVEITGISTKSVINGNVYAAADFYNKVYNESDETKVNSYDSTQLANCDGISEKSMYSGFYVSGADVSIIADKLVVPGSIAAMNCGEISVVGNVASNASGYAKNWVDTNVPGYENKSGYTQIWADGIVLGGYSRKLTGSTDKYVGSTIDMKADAYIYDDLEVNATASKFTLDGSYYGYNYASTDNRTYSDDFIKASTNRKYLSGVQINDGNYLAEDGEGNALVGQAHYNSSAIVVNGADSLLDLSKTDSIFIAGQAYVEMSKKKNSATTKIGDEEVTVDSYYYDKETDKLHDAGNYTLIGKDTKDSTTESTEESTELSVQDYRTGEAISVKSNQLAYIPPYRVTEEKGQIYVAWPSIMQNKIVVKDTTTGKVYLASSETIAADPNKDKLKQFDFSKIWENLSKVPVIKTVVSGKPNYFYDFSKADVSIKMNDYMEAYAALFEIPEGQARSVGTMADFYDITDYTLFKVDNLIIDSDDDLSGVDGENDKDDIENKIYSNSAISYKKGDKINVIADSKSVAVLTTAKKALEKMDRHNLNKTEMIEVNNTMMLTTSVQSEYKEMKMLLTNTAMKADTVKQARDAAESTITPINYHFDLTQLVDGTMKTKAGYKVFMSEKDVIVGDNEPGGNPEKIKGIVICKGDVTFDPKVKEFEGLIVAGGKIKVEQSINFVANAEVVKSILREFYDMDNVNKLKDRTDLEAKVCRLFRKFAENYIGATGNPEENVESMKSVTAVVYEDMLSFENWKKNVD